jgi:hypothetical protein
MKIRKGSCLCSACEFEIEGKIEDVGICHCSLCRKVSGAGGNAIIRLPKEKLRWTKGADHLETYMLRPTYGVVRCRTGGSPLPASFGSDQIWISPGLMDEPIDAKISIHIFCNSAADWDVDSEEVRHYEEFPT